MRRRPSAPLLLALAYVGLILSWVATNPPGSAPDEPAHLTRARSVADGQWEGRPAQYEPSPEFGPRQLPWINRVARSFDLDQDTLYPGIATCNAFRPEVSSACLDASLEGARREGRVRTYLGSYQPFVYLPAGLAAAPFDSPAAGVLAGRVVIALLSASLLALAVAALWAEGDGAWPLVGVLAATSPMVVFLSSTLSPNAIEITAGLALMATVIRLAREEASDRRWWIAAGISGVALGLSRPVSPAWVVAAGVLLVALLGARGALRSIRRGGRTAAAAVVASALSCGLSVAWELVVQPHPAAEADALDDRLLHGFSELPEVLRQMIGVFGWLDAAMPAAAYAAWRLLVIVLVVLAIVVGSRRQRIVLLGALAATITATVGLAALVIYPSGFGMQGRYVLPLAVAVPLLAGEILRRRRGRLGPALPSALPIWSAGLVALVHGAGWYANGRRHAVGVKGPLVFIGRGEWSPVGGWAFWAVVVVACLALIVASALVARATPAPSSA